MKRAHYFLITLFLLTIMPKLTAQPFTLDEEIKPQLLELRDNPQGEGAKGLVTNATIQDKDQYFYVKGHDMFQFIDVFVFSNYGDPEFKVNLVNDTWKDIQDSQNSKTSEKGVMHFKFRSQGSFGLQVFPGNETINYTIVVNASEPSKEFLGSAFKKITKGDMGDSEEITSENNSQESQTNYILYIILGVALLVIGFLAAKLSNKNKVGILIFLLFNSVSISAYSQSLDEITSFDIEDIVGEEYNDWLEEHGETLLEEGASAMNDLEERLDRLDFVGKKIKELSPYKKLKELKDLYDSYKGISACIDAAPPPGMPKIPSFCDTSDCEMCFVNARRDFEEVRYLFVKLQAIYKCTMKFTNAAVSFGDNVSGVHGVSGLAWQNQKFKILKSVEELKKSYDKKYQELLVEMQKALMELNDCEAEHGIPDWYDRFGYMYYDFTKNQYQRND